MISFLGRVVWGDGSGASAADRATLNHLAGPAEFARMLQRERARSDRSGEEFSLLVFSSRSQRAPMAGLASLARILQRRLRLTDDAGWLDGRRIGALLPMTPAAGAWKVADDVLRSIPAGVPVPACEVYGYPSRWWPDRDIHGDGRSQAAPGNRPVLAMETLFLRSMPLWKRCIDVAGAALAILLLLPLLAAIAMAVRWTSPGPVFFRQHRSGLGGRRFLMYKFRSMVDGAEAAQESLRTWNEQDGPAFKIRKDPRVTPVGRVLRKTSLDELPQLWNVLKGEMSLVGPRPLPCGESACCAPWQKRRLDVTPGLTCIWQVRGRSRVSFAEWVRMDLRYIAARSLAMDFKLLFQTLPAVLFAKGL